MGNEGNRPNSASDGQKIILRLRNREILLHYAFKMKLMISDIALFPHELEGLRLWDSDIVLARFAILESERFRGKDVVVLKAGVGVAGIALKKWTDCKEVVMCDTRDEVVNNMSKNCEKNGVRGLNCCKIDFKDLGKTAAEFDCLLCADILNNGLPPQLILEIFRKLLKDGGEAIIVMPERKELARRFLEQVDRKEFKIVNLILTAEEYEASPLFNKLEGASEFPLLTSNFYAISLTRVKINREKGQEERKNIIQLKPVVEEEKERGKESENKGRINGRAAIRETSFIPKQKVESPSVDRAPQKIEEKSAPAEKVSQVENFSGSPTRNQPPKQAVQIKPNSQQQFEDIPETHQQPHPPPQPSHASHLEPPAPPSLQPSKQCGEGGAGRAEARQQPGGNSGS